MKLLAAETVAFFHRGLLKSQVQKLLQAGTSQKLKRELEELEAGSIFRHLNITNFLEGDLFAWYTAVWSNPIEKLVRDLMARLDNYNPGTLSEDPATSRDLLKKLYQQLFPKSVRHDLGEYYTPDWLAEHVLNELGYEGDPDKRLLDPACGSGTFLIMAINRIRKWYEENRERCTYDEADLCRKILANVIGFDLNPLAVLAARTNYLNAIRPLVSYVDKVEIPIYLCDSIMTPSEYGDLFSGGSGKSKAFKTAAVTFVIPTEIATSKEDVAKYAEQLEFCVKNSFSTDEFLTRCRDEGLPTETENVHVSLYSELVALAKANKNGVWARIIKNAFAPLFVGKVDYIAGNPPWVFWNNLAPEYREQVRALMADTYEIIAKRASTMRRLGQAGKDISMLFFYVASDHYLSRSTGQLGLVITQTLFQSTAATEFRRFELPDETPICVPFVDDWVEVDPFVSAANKTAVLYAHPGETTSYPLRYRKWTPTQSFDRESATPEEVYAACTMEELLATPSTADRRSFWVLTKKERRTQRQYSTSSLHYKARRGVETTLESAFRVRILQQVLHSDTLIIENNRDRARKEVPEWTGRVEKALIYPYLTGESIHRWIAEPRGYYIVPHRPEAGIDPISEAEMKRQFKQTYAFFASFKAQLEQRSLYKRWGKNKPFYSMFDIGTYTFNLYRVAWKRTTKKFAASVIGYFNDEWLGRVLLIPNGKVMFIPCATEQAAHFVCALLNSSPARLRINSSISSEAHAEIINLVELPAHDLKDSIHTKLAELSAEAHSLAGAGRLDDVSRVEREIDTVACQLWGIKKTEFGEIASALLKMERGRR